MDLSRDLRVCMGIDGVVSAEGVVYGSGGATQWFGPNTILYQRQGPDGAIVSRTLPDGIEMLVTAGANDIFARNGVWAVRDGSGYRDSFGRHEPSWCPLAIDDSGAIAVCTDYQEGVGLSVLIGANRIIVEPGQLTALEAGFTEGQLLYRASGLRWFGIGGPLGAAVSPSLPRVSGVQHDGYGLAIGWHDGFGLVVYRLGTSRGLPVSADGRDFHARIRKSLTDETRVLVSSSGAGERPGELRRYVIDFSAGTVNGVSRAWVDLTAGVPASPAPPVEPEGTVSITAYTPTSGVSPLKVRAVAEVTGDVMSLRWRYRTVPSDTWVTDATNYSDDLDHTFTFTALGSYDIGVDALDSAGRILDATGSVRRVSVVSGKPIPLTRFALMPGAKLESGQRLESMRHRVELRADGRLVLSRHDGAELWEASGHGDTLTMQQDGNLVLSQAGVATWHSETHGHPNALAILQNDGNFVVYNDAMAALWATDTSDPVIVAPDKAPVLAIVGDEWRDRDKLYVPNWASELALPVRIVSEQEERLNEVVSLGHNGVRVFFGALIWAGQSAALGLEQLPKILDMTKARGLALLATLVTDSKHGGYDWRQHLRSGRAICERYSHVAIDGLNEIGHGTQSADATMENIAAVLEGCPIPWSVGALNNHVDEPQKRIVNGKEELYWPMARFGTFTAAHPDRGRDGLWEMARHTKELYDVSQLVGKPCLNQEGIGADVRSEAGRRSSEPAVFATMAAIAAGFPGVGGVLHSQSGLHARRLTPEEERCAAAWNEVFRVVRGFFGNSAAVFKNVGHDGSPIKSADFSRQVRAYSLMAGDRGLVIVIGESPLGARLEWQHGWRPTDTLYKVSASDGRSLRISEIAR